ncbi:MAG TPA: tripartite tricarboxylate transporter substrate binding protein [Burkholderiales bacterium]|nr:tripartite tricarboxylate transporter substrate binding protein [Burkholderiales bacterium]
MTLRFSISALSLRKRQAALAVLLLLLPLAGSVGAAERYPMRPIRFVVPFAPGGSTDTLARTIGQKLSTSLGEQVVVDNRSGANGMIGMQIVATAPPDGYTIVLGYIANLAIDPSLYKKLPYDPIRDYAPITQLAESPNILAAHPSVPVKSFKELLAYVRTHPRQLNFASSSVGSVGHLTGELLNQLAGIDLQHVPYKGSGQAVIDLVAGQVQLMFSGMSSVMPHIKSGRLKALAVTGAQRSPAVPDVPTIAESGFPGFEATAWYGVLAPPRTPRAVVMRLHDEIVKALALPDVKERLQGVGFEIVGSTPEQFGAYMKSEITKWAKVVKASGAKAE